MVWIGRALALAIHERQLAEHGGRAGVRDEASLETALARAPRLFAYGEPVPDLAALAAALAYGLARNHPFVDGNKRTAHVCYRVFLSLNDAALHASDEEKYAQMIGLSDGTLSEAEFAAWVRTHLAPGSQHGVNEARP